MPAFGSFQSLVRFCWTVPIAALLFAQAVSAQTGDRDPEEYEEDYDFSWLDPDKTVYVIQNRKYTKGRKLELMLGGGLNLSGPYSNSQVVMGRAGYFFNEQFGLSVLGGWQSNGVSDTLVELKKTSSVFPNVREVESFFGGTFVWVPFYGKINLFNQIFYIDWAVEVGVASASTRTNMNFQAANPDTYASTTHTGFLWGTGLKFFITKTFAARVDMLALYFSAPVVRQGVITAESTTNDNYYLTLGLSAHF